jgi:SagB-type dehydrogenase family enzyme
MKKIWIVIIGVVILLFVLAFASAIFADNPVKLVVNGKAINAKVPPQIINRRVMVPVRWVADKIGATAAWDEKSSTIFIATYNYLTNEAPGNNGGSLQAISTVVLPSPSKDGSVSVEKALSKRNSVRSYDSGPLTLAEISQLVWAAQGIKDQKDGGRTAPSAGALYPLEVYVFASNVIDLSPGIYKYNSQNHELLQLIAEDKKSDLFTAVNQTSVNKAPVSIVITGNYQVLAKYSEKAEQFVHQESGHTAQNICLQAVSLQLGTVTIGSFDEDAVKKVLPMPFEEHALYVMPVGRSS